MHEHWAYMWVLSLLTGAELTHKCCTYPWALSILMSAELTREQWAYEFWAYLQDLSLQSLSLITSAELTHKCRAYSQALGLLTSAELLSSELRSAELTRKCRACSRALFGCGLVRVVVCLSPSTVCVCLRRWYTWKTKLLVWPGEETDFPFS